MFKYFKIQDKRYFANANKKKKELVINIRENIKSKNFLSSKEDNFIMVNSPEK